MRHTRACFHVNLPRRRSRKSCPRRAKGRDTRRYECLSGCGPSRKRDACAPSPLRDCARSAERSTHCPVGGPAEREPASRNLAAPPDAGRVFRSRRGNAESARHRALYRSCRECLSFHGVRVEIGSGDCFNYLLNNVRAKNEFQSCWRRCQITAGSTGETSVALRQAKRRRRQKEAGDRCSRRNTMPDGAGKQEQFKVNGASYFTRTGTVLRRDDKSRTPSADQSARSDQFEISAGTYVRESIRRADFTASNERRARNPRVGTRTRTRHRRP